MRDIEVRAFRKEDMQKLGELYHAVTSNNKNAVFWWVGEEHHRPNVFVAIENEMMLAKGQVEVISTIPTGGPQRHAHYIYFNLKTIPQRENDYPLYDLLYECMLRRAYDLKDTLPRSNRTMIGVGNHSTEARNNNYFISKGFVYSKSLYTMRRDLSEKIGVAPLAESFRCVKESMDTEEKIQEYIETDMEIWPDAPIGYEQFMNKRNHASWTMFIVREHTAFAGSIMAWVDEEGEGIVEDLFVRLPWRNQGIAKHLLSQALTYLKNQGCATADLQVETANASALSLYHSSGFKEISEEVRYHREL
ncbi:GNAT family N-acetyltransferase [Paenibacillus cookii]|uniref:N-acetyltransferase domain-containing protein n=1 Tax=Paenibacillus cookii TaxID=157839 RepID=A0ABQ4M3U7_9BACL|nr:GNAT family N-acetyltransferase [Paenibacillus cookii]GIO70166.1 hypothetical protein J21TS3_49870 [Paenibacillus cookii]